MPKFGTKTKHQQIRNIIYVTKYSCFVDNDNLVTNYILFIFINSISTQCYTWSFPLSKRYKLFSFSLEIKLKQFNDILLTGNTMFVFEHSRILSIVKNLFVFCFSFQPLLLHWSKQVLLWHIEINIKYVWLITKLSLSQNNFMGK